MRSDIFFALILFFTAILIILFWVLPQYQNMVAIQKVVADFETAKKEQENYFEELRRTARELERAQEILSKIDSALPSNPSLPELFNFLHKLSTQCGLVFSQISSITTNSLPDSELKATEIGIVLSGNYADLKKFLSGLENSSRLIEVENISFSSSEKEPFQFNLKIKVYSY